MLFNKHHTYLPVL